MDSLCDDFQKIISDNNIVVWGTKGCGACVKAKQLLKSKNFASRVCFECYEFALCPPNICE